MPEPTAACTAAPPPPPPPPPAGPSNSQNGSTPHEADDDGGSQAWESRGIPEYMQDPGDSELCESWEETLQRGAERSGQPPLPAAADLLWQTIRCAAVL